MAMNVDNYDLVIEFLSENQDIDEEMEFLDFCSSLANPYSFDEADSGGPGIMNGYLLPPVRTPAQQNTFPQQVQANIPLYADGTTHNHPQNLMFGSISGGVRHNVGRMVLDSMHNNISIIAPPDFRSENVFNNAPISSIHSDHNRVISSVPLQQIQQQQNNSSSFNLYNQQAYTNTNNAYSNMNTSNSSNNTENNSATKKQKVGTKNKKQSMNLYNTDNGSSNGGNNNSNSSNVNKYTEVEYIPPPVDRNDIRLSYARIFMDAFNGFDKASLRAKLTNYCTQDCILSVKWTGSGNPCGPSSRLVTGITAVLSLMDAIMFSAVPDLLWNLIISKLKIKSDTSSYILCTYAFTGTQIYKIERPTEDNSNNSTTIMLNSSDFKTLYTNTALTSNNTTANNNNNSINSNSKRKADDISCEPSVNGLPVALLPDREIAGVSSTRINHSSKNKTFNKQNSDLNASDVLIHSIKLAETAANSTQIVPNSVTSSMFTTNTTLNSSKKLFVVGSMILHIDKEKKIFKFEFIQESISQALYQSIITQYENSKTNSTTVAH